MNSSRFWWSIVHDLREFRFDLYCAMLVEEMRLHFDFDRKISNNLESNEQDQ